MKYIPNDYCTFFDIDETLVLWNLIDLTPEEKEKVITIRNKLTSVCCASGEARLLPHERNIELLKRKKHQGQMIIVWSASGSKWAKAVLKKLKLTKYVDFVMCKPYTYVDDLDISEWGCKRVYLRKTLPPHDHSEELKEGE